MEKIADCNMSQEVTYLSHYVHKIIVDLSNISSNSPKKLVTQDLIYDWLEIEYYFGGVDDDLDLFCQSEEWILSKAEVVWSAVHSAASTVRAVPSWQRQILYQLSEWVCCQLDIANYYDESIKDPEVGTLLAILYLTSSFERSLGNVYLMKNSPVPFLLRDLLGTKELKLMFGKVPILFTQLLLGCPKGLNLRNVVWHGFVSKGELHPDLVAGLIVLFASLGQLLPTCQKLPKRPQFSSFDKFQEHLGEVFCDITDNEEEVINIIETSPFISKNNSVFWQGVYKLFQQQRHVDSLLLLLPQLEHCLRTIYCTVNHCPSRVLTAEATTLYTTLDEILAPAEHRVVGDGLLMMLLDLTDSLTGPRLHDRLSHGECDLRLLPRWLVNHVFCVALAVAHEGPSQHVCHSTSLCGSLLRATSTYHSQFHVLASLRRSLQSVLQHWSSWLPCPPPSDIPPSPPTECMRIAALNERLFPDGGSVEHRLLRVQQCLDAADPPTLYRPKPELELAACLVDIVNDIALTADRLCSAATLRSTQWTERALRSRARNSALRLWALLPDCFSALLCLVMVSVLCYRRMEALDTGGKTISRLVKNLTKTVKNAVNLCDKDKNRWLETHQLLSNTCDVWLSELNNLRLME